MYVRKRNFKVPLASRHINLMVTFWLGVAFLSSLIQESSPAFALNPDKNFSQYSHDVWQAENGLPHNSINTILQTRSGYLWLGTYEGLVRFDGVRFKVFLTKKTLRK